MLGSHHDQTDNFGLINRKYDESNVSDDSQWTKLATHIAALNDQAADERYHLLVLGRHGEGWHNRTETNYGTKAWDVCVLKISIEEDN